MKEIKSIYIGVNGKAIKVWDKEGDVLQKEYVIQTIQQLRDRIAALEELRKIIREEK